MKGMATNGWAATKNMFNRAGTGIKNFGGRLQTYGNTPGMTFAATKGQNSNNQLRYQTPAKNSYSPSLSSISE
jgi:hypothetical protein